MVAAALACFLLGSPACATIGGDEFQPANPRAIASALAVDAHEKGLPVFGNEDVRVFMEDYRFAHHVR